MTHGWVECQTELTRLDCQAVVSGLHFATPHVADQNKPKQNIITGISQSKKLEGQAWCNFKWVDIQPTARSLYCN